jgi:malonyl-CoA O-methyltransferase
MPSFSPSIASATSFRKRQFERAAETYDEHSVVQKGMARRLAELYPAAPVPRRVLEIGCGTGHLSELLVDRAPRLLYLTDISERMLERCRARLAETRVGIEPGFAKLDAADPLGVTCFARLLGGAEFDLVASNAVVQWFADIAAHLALVAQLLKPGASYILSGFSRRNFPELRSVLQSTAPACGNLPGHDLSLIRQAAEHAGFEVLSLSEQDIVRHYPTVESFLITIRHSGASRFPERPRLTTQGLLRLKRQYAEAYAAKDGVPATWTPWYARLQRR